MHTVNNAEIGNFVVETMFSIALQYDDYNS